MLFDLGKVPQAVIEGIRAGLEAGKSGAEVLKTLQSAGAGVRSSTFYSAFNFIQGQLLGPEKYVQSLKPSTKPIIALLPKSITDQTRNFAYKISFNSTLVNEKGQPTDFITISTNEVLTPREAIDAAFPYASKYLGEGDISELEGTLDSITLNSAGIVESNSIDSATADLINATLPPQLS